MTTKRSEVELLMEIHLREVFGKDPLVAAEMHFHPKRKWRFDYAVINDDCRKGKDWKLAIEIEGGIWNRGRHTRGAGFQGDLCKYNTATAMGWTIFRFSTDDVKQGRDIEFLRAWYALRITPILEGA